MPDPILDLRSDTVTLPTPGMRRAVADAAVGDDVLDGDPTTRALEERVAALLGHESALFFPTGTQANQVAVGLHTTPGTEMVVEEESHLFHYEQAGGAALWGVQLRPVSAGDGRMTPEVVAPALRDPWPDLPETALVAVENTHNARGGTVTDVATLQALHDVVTARAIPMHIDGARLWHAAARMQVEPAVLARWGTTVMVSFSKGLGCPVGSCLAGPRRLMDRAMRLRRRLGGGMRQSGILAAAALYALDHHLARLEDDHRRARQLAERIRDLEGLTVRSPETNIVMVDLAETDATSLAERLDAAGLRVSVFGPHRIRLVTHLGIGDRDVDRAADILSECVQSGALT